MPAGHPRDALRAEDDACLDVAALDLRDFLVHLLERSLLEDDMRHPGRVQLENLAQVESGADDRADDGDAVQRVSKFGSSM
jgi:hypothetical protein